MKQETSSVFIAILSIFATSFLWLFPIKYILQPDAYVKGIKDQMSNRVSYTYEYEIVGGDTLNVDTLINCPSNYNK